VQTIDIVLLAVLFLPALAGGFYGFLNILFSLAAWGLALAVAVRFSGHLAPLLVDWVASPLLRSGLAFTGLFIISLMLLSLLGYFIVKLLGRTGLTAADRMLGFLFGIALGGAIIAAVVFLAGFTDLPGEPWWQASLLLEPFERIATWAAGFLPENVASHHGY
jgi:membrane protein required for colicin V production